MVPYIPAYRSMYSPVYDGYMAQAVRVNTTEDDLNTWRIISRYSVGTLNVKILILFKEVSRVIFLQVNKSIVMFIWKTNCLGIALEFLRKNRH